jgi:hypothetical protein
MNKIIIAAIGLLSSACVVHAHPHPTPAPAPHAVHRTPPPRPAPRAHQPRPVKVQAWVWVSGHQTPRGVWSHGYWELRSVPRHMLNRNPHTYVRHVKGRGRPTPPARRYR